MRRRVWVGLRGEEMNSQDREGPLVSLREILGLSRSGALAAYRDDTEDLHLTSISAHAAKVRTFAMF